MHARYDVELIQRIEKVVQKKLELYPTEEKIVLAFLDRVSEAQRHANRVRRSLECCPIFPPFYCPHLSIQMYVLTPWCGTGYTHSHSVFPVSFLHLRLPLTPWHPFIDALSRNYEKRKKRKAIGREKRVILVEISRNTSESERQWERLLPQRNREGKNKELKKATNCFTNCKTTKKKKKQKNRKTEKQKNRTTEQQKNKKILTQQRRRERERENI